MGICFYFFLWNKILEFIFFIFIMFLVLLVLVSLVGLLCNWLFMVFYIVKVLYLNCIICNRLGVDFLLGELI